LPLISFTLIHCKTLLLTVQFLVAWIRNTNYIWKWSLGLTCL